MFKAKVKPEVLKELVEVVSILVDEAKFTVKKGELQIKAVDPAHVAMVELRVDKKAFEEYKADESELGVNLLKFRDVLKLTNPGDVIAMEHNEEKNQLVLKVGNITRKMALVDTTGLSDPKVPNLNLPVKVVIKAEELRKVIKASESVSDHIALETSPEEFKITSEGDNDSADLVMSKHMLNELDCKEGARSLFPLDYFSNMVKAISTSETVTMLMGNDYPVKMEFSIAGGNGSSTYLLAPRIEND
ncbi:MAG: proliferating cell nuclear antigen (pcna) [Euryarchaeota archaeon]|nr:proliferating cell nuclear antigen (pcna) [Euryarchaeota archaeon]